jgi:hypothetical protein
LHKVDNKVEHLLFDLDPVLAPTQFATVYVQGMFAEFVPHWPLPRPTNAMVKEKKRSS